MSVIGAITLDFLNDFKAVMPGYKLIPLANAQPALMDTRSRPFVSRARSIAAAMRTRYSPTRRHTLITGGYIEALRCPNTISPTEHFIANPIPVDSTFILIKSPNSPILRIVQLELVCNGNIQVVVVYWTAHGFKQNEIRLRYAPDWPVDTAGFNLYRVFRIIRGRKSNKKSAWRSLVDQYDPNIAGSHTHLLATIKQTITESINIESNRYHTILPNLILDIDSGRYDWIDCDVLIPHIL